MSFDLVVRGRLALPGEEPVPGAVVVRDGRIVAIDERASSSPARRELDVGEALVLPGVVDAHVHTRSALDEGIAPATRAAAAGGVTTVLDMPYDAGTVVQTPEAFAAKIAAVEREAVVDVGLWATVPPDGATEHIPTLVRAGACAFKVSTYETDPVRFPRIADDRLLAVFAAAADAGGLVAAHCENDEIVRAGIASLRESGRRDAPAHAESRPPIAETEAIGRVLELACATGVRVHLCHVTVARGVELARRARDLDSVDVTLETCPHYLVLDENELARRGGEAKINPPLRPVAEREALWEALAGGRITLVASDHVGWPAVRKHGDDVFALASGAPGLELMLPLVHGECVRRGLGVASLARVLAEAPARRFGLWPRKGALIPGADADLVVLDPDATWEVDPVGLVTGTGWSPYAGRTVRGRVLHTFVRGVEVFDGATVANPGHGTFVPSRRSDAGVDG